MSNEQTNLIPVTDDGFNDSAGDEQRLIQGSILRCVDGHWADGDGVAFPPETKLLALATAMALQHWKDKLPIETILKKPGEPLPDLDELNAKIPKKQWELGLDKKPRPPWVRQHIVYLLNPADAGLFTFINSTVGASIAVDRLKTKVQWMRALRGANVVPVVQLDSKPMKTKLGQKLRPEFIIVEWQPIRRRRIGCCAHRTSAGTTTSGRLRRTATGRIGIAHRRDERQHSASLMNESPDGCRPAYSSPRFRDALHGASRSLRRVAVCRRSNHQNLCIGYAVDDGPVRIWIPGQPVPAEFHEAATDPTWLVVAHNNQFEAAIEERLLQPRYGWPLVPLERHRCTMAMALAAALPGALENAAAALDLPYQKDREGRRLMLRLSRCIRIRSRAPKTCNGFMPIAFAMSKWSAPYITGCRRSAPVNKHCGRSTPVSTRAAFTSIARSPRRRSRSPAANRS